MTTNWDFVLNEIIIHCIQSEGKLQIFSSKKKKPWNLCPSLKQLQKDIFKEGGNSINGLQEVMMSRHWKTFCQNL